MSRNNHDKSVLVAMSGGVDSSVALYLLKEQGYKVTGATMKLWDFSEVGGAEHARSSGGCCDLEAINNARNVCQFLGVPHYVLDFSIEFKEIVIDNFVDEYKHGRTPNPCILCNTEIKWEMFLKRAREIGCDYMATGHYSRVDYDDEQERYTIRRGLTNNRDQAYALWGISQEALARTILPLGELYKSDTRRIAREAGLKTADTAESMEICFVTDDNYERFMREWTGDDISPGDIVDASGNILGQHKGIPFYTIGQRKGLCITHDHPLYVNRIDVENNRIHVCDGTDVYTKNLIVSNINWVSIPPQNEPFRGHVQIRYQHVAQLATVYPEENGKLKIIFDEPQRAITPGQSAVIFNDDILLAGGFIESR
ncbi:MAG: tRNA 2-thiouridine(34) synthase MnmA [Candidatus Zixiibacteriota bacterium]